MENTISIYNKMFNILNEITGVAENGYNSYQKYKYIKQEDIINTIKPLLIKNRLLITNEIVEEESSEVNVGKGNSILSKVTIEFTITDLDSMAQIKQRYRGHGMDVGDKGIYKAMTGAEKYFYMKNFLIGTGNDDPEFNGANENPYYDNKDNNKSKQQSNQVNNQSRNNNVSNINNNVKANPSNMQNNNMQNRSVPGTITNRPSSSAVNVQRNSQPINPLDVKMPIDMSNNTNVEANTEPRIDERLQKLLFVAANQEKDIVLNAIQKLGYKSTAQVKVSEYKRVLELIKAQVKLLR